jgi:hypothetical protein
MGVRGLNDRIVVRTPASRSRRDVIDNIRIRY